MSSFNQLISRKSIKSKSKKSNGFTMVELMIGVAIVGTLSAVALPQLTKAQDRAKDSAASSTLQNAAKQCSITLISDAPITEYTDYTAQGKPFELVEGTCAANTKLTLDSDSGAIASVQFDGKIPEKVKVNNEPENNDQLEDTTDQTL